MSLHSDIMAVWPAHLVTLGVVSVAGQVYTGRKLQDKADSRLDVWLQRMPRSRAGQGLQRVTVAPYVVHVRRPGNGGPNQAGGALLTTVEAHLETLMTAYDGKRPLYAGNLASVLSMRVEEESLDEAPDDSSELVAAARVTWLVKE